ncbi:MAG: hypothetical protein EU542_01120 [Promethearchaeota archaeon]|nr:MAG: hypothetical protein EU542_01120 [Candidatus Lokiarchaeota archaeon]
MFQTDKTQYKFKTYRSDASPFFFFIDIFPLDLKMFETSHSLALAKHIKNNPIMPLPMRIDRVFNGESSVLIRPNSPVSFPLNESIVAIINPIPFLQLGIEKLLFFTEIRSHQELLRSLKPQKVKEWWENTRYLYGNLRQIEEDFSAFLKAYLYTIIKAEINEEDITGAAIEYCEIVNNICKERMLKNKILVEIKDSQESVKLYREKKTKNREKLNIVKKMEYHPELIDIEVFNFSDIRFPNKNDFNNNIIKNHESYVAKYIPLLLYDDLQECMIQNISLLEKNVTELLNPSFLLENNVIILLHSEKIEDNDLNKYNWLSDLSEVNIQGVLNSITQIIIP